MKRKSSLRLRLVAAVLCAAILGSFCSCSEEDLIGLITDFISYADAWTDGPESSTDGETEPDPDGTEPQAGTGSEISAELSVPALTSSSHIHSFRINAETEPTCTSPGKIFLECSCGFLKTEEVPALGHDFEKYRDIPATCDKEGKTRYDCKRCGVSDYEVTSPPLGHAFELKETVAPTTSSAGYDLYVCGRCGIEERRNETPVLAGASYTDVCSMKSYLVSAMPHETAADVTGILLQYALKTEGKSVPRNGFSPDDVYKGLKEAHNYVMRNVVFGSGAEKCSLYACSESDVSAMRSDFSWVAGSVSSLGIGGTTTVRSAVESINNYLCAKLRYDYAGKNSDAHRAISSGTGICQVYGQLFQLMCQYCGIECYYVEDTAHDHVYNYIVFSDESRLYVDVTWNDSATKTHVEVENAGYTAEQIAVFRSKYLLMTYDEFKTAHGW